MKNFLFLFSFSALAFCLTSSTSYAMEDSERTEQIGAPCRIPNDHAIRAYLENPDIHPKIALYGEGDAHTREVDYSPFLTVDNNPKNNPKVLADITFLPAMADIPDGQLDQVELRSLPTFVFDRNFIGTFTDINRVLKPGGILKFNDNMSTFSSAAHVREKLLEVFAKGPERFRHLYEKKAAMAPKALIAEIYGDRHNPFHVYLDEKEWEEAFSKKGPECTYWPAYIEQLSTFFAKVGFTDLTPVENYQYWMVHKL